MLSMLRSSRSFKFLRCLENNSYGHRYIIFVQSTSKTTVLTRFLYQIVEQSLDNALQAENSCKRI